MDLKLNILNLARDLSAHSAARQAVLAENVANADTPGYAARDIAPFSKAYEGSETGTLAMRATRPGHLHSDGGRDGYRVVETAPIGAESPNGNTVSLEDQLLKSAEVRQNHALALGVYSKSLGILRQTLGRQ